MLNQNPGQSMKQEKVKVQFRKTELLCMEWNIWYLDQHILYSIAQAALVLIFVNQAKLSYRLWYSSITAPGLSSSSYIL